MRRASVGPQIVAQTRGDTCAQLTLKNNQPYLMS